MSQEITEQTLNGVGQVLDFKLSREEALKTQRCCKCGKTANTFRDELSVKEYYITIWCQQCLDDYFDI